MAYVLGHTPSHKGEVIAEEPIRDLDAIAAIKKALESRPRDYALFVVGINTAFRCGDLVKIKVGQVRGLNAGDDVVLREEKTNKTRRVTLNQNAANAIATLLSSSDLQDDEYLFKSQRGQLTVSYVNRMVKTWCKNAGLTGQFGSHTLRKTWGYHQRVQFKTPIEHLMLAYNHASPAQTLTYICIQPEEMKSVYANCL